MLFRALMADPTMRLCPSPRMVGRMVGSAIRDRCTRPSDRPENTPQACPQQGASDCTRRRRWSELLSTMAILGTPAAFSGENFVVGRGKKLFQVVQAAISGAVIVPYQSVCVLVGQRCSCTVVVVQVLRRRPYTRRSSFSCSAGPLFQWIGPTCSSADAG